MAAVEDFIVNIINNNLWKVIPFLLLAAGIYFGVRTIVVQIRKVPDMFRAVAEAPADKNSDEISAFKAFTISAASRVGTGNVAGVALAIILGGPGAVFWMWIVAIVGGATAFVEATLAQLFKTKEEGHYRGGPAYYITRGLNSKVLATIFAIAISITYGIIYQGLQSNAVVEAITVSMGAAESTAAHVVIGLLMAFLAGLIIIGGVKRISDFTQVVVPFMAGAYVIIGLIVTIVNITEVPGMIALIVGSALGFREVAGATIGLAFMNGMRRGLFSNEAGEGSAPNAAAAATVSHPVKQGLVQTLGVYFDTLLVCSITAFILLLSDYQPNPDESSSYTQYAVADVVGDWGIHFVTVVIFFLAFSSVIGNYYLAEQNVKYLTGSRAALMVFQLIGILAVFLGAVASTPLVWALGDTFAGIMVFINLIAIVPLGKYAFALLKNYSIQRAQGIDPVFHRDMLPEIADRIECWDGSDSATEHYQKGYTALAAEDK